MRRFSAVIFGILLGLVVAVASHAQNISWTLPSTYTDNSAIPAAAQATITTKLYYDVDQVGTPSLFATVTNGATSWTGTLPTACAAKGFTCYYTATATIPAEGQESAFAPYVSYTVPYVPPANPTGIVITR